MTDRACTAPRNTWQKGDSQGPNNDRQNHPEGLHNTLHLKVYIRGKQRYRVRQQRKKREQKGANIRKYGHILYRKGDASNPGPGTQNSKYIKLGDYFSSTSYEER
eukprot:4055583-Heterocapsa_arctica.AAC.1